MTIPPKAADAMIFVDPPLDWKFSCNYVTSYDVTNDMTVSQSSIQNDFEGNGRFDVSLRTVSENYTSCLFCSKIFMSNINMKIL